VHPIDCPIVEPGHPKRAPITDATIQDLPCILEVVPIFPSDLEHVPKVLGLGVAQTKRRQTADPVAEGRDNPMRGHEWSGMPMLPSRTTRINV
jgi:hypothetical protein